MKFWNKPGRGHLPLYGVVKAWSRGGEEGKLPEHTVWPSPRPRCSIFLLDD